MEMILRDRNRELTSFAHKIAHGLNSPLSMLTGYADYLTRHAGGGDADELQRVSEKIGDAAQQAAKIVDELLFLADSSREKFVPTPINMLEIWQRVCERLTIVINDSNAEVTLSEGLPFAMGYAPWAEKVCLNLLSIALAAAPPPKKLLISGKKEPADGKIHFSIRSNETVGSPARPVARFSPEYPVASNYGVELAVIEQVMRRMDGDISINSEATDGLDLRFILPATSFSGVAPSQ
jgi:signal transduction histidine kinase